EEDGRALVRGETLAVDKELVAFGLAPEDRVVVDDERASAFVSLEEHRRREAADPSADGDQLVGLACVRRVCDSLFENAVAHCMSGAQDFPGVAVGVRVIADPAVAVEGIGGGDPWGVVLEEETGAG